MPSSIDITKPVAGSPTTLSVRQNFAAAKSEIEALQAGSATYATLAASSGSSLVGFIQSGIGVSATVTVGVELATLRDLLNNFAVELTPPSGFGWTPPIVPRWTPAGWRGDVSIQSLRPSLGSVAYYVDNQHGNDSALGVALTITNITQANPAVVTYTGADPTNGHQVFIAGVVGMTQVNGRYFTVANVNTGANTIELSGVDSSAYTAYGSDGEAILPLKGIDAAIAKNDGTVIYVAPSTYFRDDDFGSANPATSNASLVVLPWRIRSGPIISGAMWDHTADLWTNDEALENTWYATRSLVAAVRDYRYITSDGEHWPYELAQSSTDCNNRRGTYYTDGATVWVHTFNDAMPDQLIRVFLTESGASYNSTKSIYVEGIEFHGGNSAFRPRNTSGAGGAVYAKDCKFFYANGTSNGNGVELEGIALGIFENCEAAFNLKDGFNYHINTTVIPKIVEINCKGHHNGRDRAGNNNGSSMHDAGTILRISGEYHHNEGPNVPDTGGSFTWNVGVSAHDSLEFSGAITKADFYNSAGSAWLYDCTADGSNYSVVVTSGGTTNTDRTAYNGATSAIASTLGTYTQR